jgi:S1-C subfamily serine protease
LFHFATGAVIDDKGHIVTRLWNLDPQDKQQDITVVISDGTTLPATFIGLDCASGFAILEVPNLKIPSPVASGSLPKEKAVKILSVDIVRKEAEDKRTGFYVVPEIRTLTGQVEAGNIYAKESGLLTLRSANLLSKNDSSVVVTDDNQLLGMAKYAGYQRADLFPIELIRDTIAHRVLEKRDSVPAGSLGVVGMNVSQLVPEQITAFGVASPTGVLVRDINADSPAAKSGIKQGDVIVALDNFKVIGTGDLGALLSTMPAGKEIKLKALRRQEPLEFKVTLGERPYAGMVFAQPFEPADVSQADDLKRRIEELQNQYRARLKEPPSPERNETLGELNVELRNLYDRMREIGEVPKPTDNVIASFPHVSNEPINCTLPAGFIASEMPKSLAEYFGALGGLLVKTVVPKSAADVAGLKAADVIVGTMQEPLTCAQLQAVMTKTQESLTLKVIRDKKPLTITLNQKQ